MGSGSSTGSIIGGALGAVGGVFIGNPVAGAMLGASAGGALGGALSGPNLPAPPKAPDPADIAVRNARLMERRRQIGLSGRMSTFLTTAQGETDAQPKATSTPVVNLLGG